jgi:leader peptidase (prepilin peptidase)/N-methyltransferase
VPLPLPGWFAPSFAFLFGAVWGSFLNVVIVRLPREESVVFPASHCVSCGAPIRPRDNIPILSYLILRGRCRACGARFSPRYAIVELLSGLAALACVLAFGASWAALGFYVFLALLLAIACIDLEHWIIPHELSWPGIAVGLAFAFVNPRVRPLEALLGAAVAWAGFTLLSWLGEKAFKKEALGLGDRWLLAMECAFLGYQAILPLVLLASLQGSTVGLILIALGKSQTGEKPLAEGGKAGGEGEGAEEEWIPPKHALPFGPFLALAGVEQLFFGPQLAHWYGGMVARYVVG